MVASAGSSKQAASQQYWTWKTEQLRGWKRKRRLAIPSLRTQYSLSTLQRHMQRTRVGVMGIGVRPMADLDSRRQ